VCDLETSRIGAPYIYDISHLRVNEHLKRYTSVTHRYAIWSIPFGFFLPVHEQCSISANYFAELSKSKFHANLFGCSRVLSQMRRNKKGRSYFGTCFVQFRIHIQ
jgi:hypothetical protein